MIIVNSTAMLGNNRIPVYYLEVGDITSVTWRENTSPPGDDRFTLHHTIRSAESCPGLSATQNSSYDHDSFYYLEFPAPDWVFALSCFGLVISQPDFESLCPKHATQAQHIMIIPPVDGLPVEFHPMS
ncbi:hypothetical protein THAOC_10813 [Thalassiosira oceanica]|uniref:Uncharacterized protein n=1 Tax=Thalassiosira oceanica TaxID=159749 RepID=K0SSV8_THAOC|nr:hypothetical protein THAOC_10813 [Thalassiosira oceanica]|eukprot:EJK68054.1 hypothetical protein THAOC_10813 [Thalassiosira oceanica]